MRTLRIARNSARALFRYKLRTGFIMLGPLIGIAALSIVVGVGGAAVNKLLATVRQLFGSSSIVVSSGGGFFMGGPRDSARLTIDDIEAIVRDVPGIDTWDPMVVVPNTSVRRADRNCLVRLMGQSERAERAWSRGVESGRFLDSTDVAASARVALIGATVARALFAEDDANGQDVQIGSVPFRVVGILERFGTDIHGMDRDNEIVIPITTALRRVMNADSIRAAKLLASDQADLETVTKEVVRVLRARHALADGQPDDFTVINSVAVREMVGRIERIVFLYIPLVTASSLLAALAVAASLMLSSVNERRAEIGLRLAVGALPADIRLQFLIETAATTLAGGSAGILLGGLMTAIVAARLGAPARLGPGAIALGLALSALTGLLAGVLPARRAALLQPSDALR